MTVGERPNWDEVPEFTASRISLRQVVPADAWALASLFAYLLVPYVAFLRYDVR